MNSSKRNMLSLLVLLCYLTGGALIEITHHDDTNFLLQSQPVLSSHDCGAKEIHVSVEDARHCLACSHFAQRFSTEAGNFSVIDASLITLASLPSHIEQTLETDILYSGKRGPPPSAA